MGDTGCTLSTDEQVAIITKYIELRKNNEIDKLAEMIADELEFLGGRGEKFTTKAEVVEHLRNNKSSGTWNSTVWDTEKNCVRVDGTVGYKMLSVSIVAWFKLNADNKICFIQQGRK
mmetsp:Transcript_20305/g.35044  ORF Transcript_20305/g.35044 Transcript_20305/m.35044 type:complete len:117 (-) Transcript_20305:138-488(-)